MHARQLAALHISDISSEGIGFRNYYIPSPPEGAVPMTTTFEKYMSASQQALASLWNRRGHKIHQF